MMAEINQSLAPRSSGADEVRSARTVCGICSGTCGISLTIENGMVTSIGGDTGHPVSRGHLCPKGQAFPELLRDPDRLKHPIRKTVSGGWEEISWDQAYGILAERLAEIKRVHGPEALAVHVGQAGVGKEFLPYVERFCAIYGTPNFSTCGSHCYASKSMANVLTFGAMPIADYEQSQCIVLWGKNPLSSAPSLAGEIIEARLRGCALIVIDPRVTELARDADIHLQLRPGTDGALALGLLHVIIEEGLYDKEFVETWTLGFESLCDRVAEYTPERVEQITWVPASRIREAARMYGSASSACISVGVGLELSTNGFHAARSVAALQAATGNLDIEGGAIFLREARLSDLTLAFQNHGKPAIGADEYPLFYASTGGSAQANLYARAILEGKPYPLKGLVVVGSNPVLTWPNAHRVRQALERLEFLAVMDPFMTETAKLADFVLPCATFLGGNELWDSSHLSSAPRLGLAPKLCHDGLPTNWEVWKEISTRMEYKDFFPWETEEDAIDFRLRSLNMTLEDLKKMPEGHRYHQWTEKKYEREGFKTPSGKVEFYSTELQRYGYDPLPAYQEPSESPLSVPHVADLYPLVLTTGARTVEFLHSRFRNVPSLRNRSPEPHVEINPRTARDLNVLDGEIVHVKTRRGKIRLKARCSDAILPGVISIPHGWNHANANVLTDDADLDPVTGFPADRALLACVLKEA